MDDGSRLPILLSVLLMLGDIDHHAEGIAPLGGDIHAVPPFVKRSSREVQSSAAFLCPMTG